MDADIQPRKSRKSAIMAVLVLLLIASLAFGAWAFSSRQSYKNDSDAKVAAAVAVAKKQQSATDQANFDQQLKQPYKTFTGPATYGSITFNYPKTWSAYVDQTGDNEPINGYFYPGEVPGVSGNTAYPLRVELLDNDYSTVVGQYQSQVTEGSLTSSAYVPPKMKGVANVETGVKLDGAIGQDSNGNAIQGSMVIIKVRDKTLQIYTQTTSSLSDFNDIILASLSFVP